MLISFTGIFDRPCNFHIPAYFLTIQKQVEERTGILLVVSFHYLKKREVKSGATILCNIAHILLRLKSTILEIGDQILVVPKVGFGNSVKKKGGGGVILIILLK